MIYVSSSCLKSNNLAQIIEELAQNDIRNIELSGGTDYYDEIESDLEKLKQIYHLQYVCHAYFPPPKIPFVINLASCNDKIYEKSINHYVQCIDMLERMHCKVLSIHAGFLVEIKKDELGKSIHPTEVYDEDKAYDRFCTAYEYIAKLCIKGGIELFLENNVLSKDNYRNFNFENLMMMTDYDSVMKMKRLIDFNFLLDLGHLYVSSKALNEDYVQQCRLLKKYVKWIHISENNGMIDEHKPLRKNSDIMKEFIKMYSPHINVTLETVGDIEEILKSKDILGSCKNI